MANQETKAKSGMEGRGSRTGRWGRRRVIEEAAKKQRRKEDGFSSQENRYPAQPPLPPGGHGARRPDRRPRPGAGCDGSPIVFEGTLANLASRSTLVAGYLVAYVGA